MIDHPNKFIWDSDSTASFTEKLSSEDCKQRAEILLSKENLKMEDIKMFLMDTAKDSKIRKTKSNRRKRQTLVR